MADTAARASYKEGLAFTIKIRGHTLVSDLPPAKGGKDEGPTPPELMVAALAACAGIFAAMFARKAGISPEGIEVEAEADTLESPTRLGNFRARIKFPGLPQEMRERAKAFIGACLVGQTLKRENQVTLELE